jgi:ribonuclease-3
MEDNERLEFLGDAILSFLAADYLYEVQPQLTEEQMTRYRSLLVDEKQLAHFAEVIGVVDQLRLGKGLRGQGVKDKPGLLSDAFEAVVGAYYLDQDYDIEAVRPVMEALFDSVMPQLQAGQTILDPKSQLQQLVQQELKIAPPTYRTEKDTHSPDHNPRFTAIVIINGQTYGQGEGPNKKEAEKAAAIATLEQLKSSPLS